MNENEHIFFSDLKFPGQYYGVLVRSPAQCGKLAGIASPDLPEGYFLFTAADIPGKNSVEINGGSVPVFAEAAVSYIGEPVGIIAGPDYETAAALAEKTEVIIEDNAEKTERSRIEQTAQKGDCSIFFLQKDNGGILKNPDEGKNKNGRDSTSGDSKNIQGENAVDNASSYNAERLTEQSELLTITESCAEILPMEYFYAEHSGAVVRYKKDHLEIYAASLWPSHIQKTVSTVLALSTEKITVIQTDSGENHDGKIWLPSIAAAQAAFASFLCKKSVKLIFSRAEDFRYSAKSPPIKIKIKSAATPDGKIRAMETGIEINPGSGTPFIDEITTRMTIASQGFYNIENNRTSIQFAKTNLPPMMPANDFGESNVFVALETHMDLLSRQLGMLPAEIRQINIAEKKYLSITETVCEKSGFNRKYTAYGNLNQKLSKIKDEPVRGIGLSLGYQGSGFVSTWTEGIQYSVEITMETTGEVHIKSGSYSSSIKEIICAITADFLSIDKNQISFADAEPDVAALSGPDILSSSVAIISPLVSKCCASIQRQRFRKPLPITVKKTYKPAKPLNFAGDVDIPKSGAFVSFTPGACVVELELNPLDWTIKTRGIWIACSAGKVLDRHAAENTLKKTVKETLAKLSCEGVKIEGGRFCRTNRFGFGIPAIVPTAEPHVYFSESKEIPGGLGNIAQNLLPAAYCSALMQITGKPEVKIPVAIGDIYNCLSGADSGEI